MKKSRFVIGVMDSGMGGISVLNELATEVSSCDYIYFGDLANSPYGNKDREQVLKFVENSISFMTEKGANAVVLACNTATSAAVAHIRANHSFPIFGMEPAIKPAIEENPNEKVAVLATSLTLKEEKFSTLGKTLNAGEKLFPINCDGLATLVDREDIAGAREFLLPIFENLEKEQIQTIVLGCTHYVLLKPIILEWNKNVKIYDGNTGTTRHVKSSLGVSSEDRESRIDIFLNGGTEYDLEIATRYLNLNPKEERYVK
ncbi:MAG: glutamate racemase [Leptospiraceae bacterium]|nr:glutamate racemase [Leptospiraceae bacterium]